MRIGRVQIICEENVCLLFDAVNLGNLQCSESQKWASSQNPSLAISWYIDGA